MVPTDRSGLLNHDPPSHRPAMQPAVISAFDPLKEGFAEAMVRRQRFGFKSARPVGGVSDDGVGHIVVIGPDHLPGKGNMNGRRGESIVTEDRRIQDNRNPPELRVGRKLTSCDRDEENQSNPNGKRTAGRKDRPFPSSEDRRGGTYFKVVFFRHLS